MEGRDRCEIGARACLSERDAAAETVSDRRDLAWIHVRVLLELIHRRLESRVRDLGILQRFGHEFLGVGRMRRDLALAVHVEREPDVPGPREPLGLPAGVRIVPPPLMDDEHALDRRGSGRRCT